MMWYNGIAGDAVESTLPPSSIGALTEEENYAYIGYSPNPARDPMPKTVQAWHMLDTLLYPA